MDMTQARNTTWSFSAVGRDRPGIVAAFAEVFYRHQCNLLDSTMTNLAGQFAVVMLLDLSEQTKPEALSEEMARLAAEWGLKIALGPVDSEAIDDSADGGESYLVSVYGADRAGIMWKISDAVAKAGFNVTDLSTKRVEGSTPVYILLLEVSPTDISHPVDQLESQLKSIGEELGCSVSVKAVESATL